MVSLPDGYTVVIGGLDVETETKAVSQVPVLGWIPGIGELFKSRIVSRTKSRFFGSSCSYAAACCAARASRSCAT